MPTLVQGLADHGGDPAPVQTETRHAAKRRE